MVMYDNDFEIKEKQKLIEIKKSIATYNNLCDQFLHYNWYIVALWIYTEEYLLMIDVFFVFKFVCFCIILFMWLMVIFLLVCREEIWDKLPKDNRQVTLLVFR